MNNEAALFIHWYFCTTRLLPISVKLRWYDLACICRCIRCIIDKF